MGITEQTRKILWAKSGNKCALCKQDVVLKIGGTNANHVVIGEECHIVSPKEGGPRHREMENYDTYDNLIILCANHHSLIDKSIDKYSEKYLKELKKKHELSIEKNTCINEEKDTFPLLHEVAGVKELVRILHGVEQYGTDFPSERTEDYDLFQSFISTVNNSDIFYEYDEFTRMSFFEDDYNELIKKGYHILVGFLDHFGKYKLSTTFVYIVTTEDCEKKFKKVQL